MKFQWVFTEWNKKVLIIQVSLSSFHHSQISIAILPQSKKIEKPLTQPIIKDPNQMTKSYTTYANNQKELIIKAFKNSLIELEELKTEISDESFLNNLDTIETDTINDALRKILPEFVRKPLEISSKNCRYQVLKIKSLFWEHGGEKSKNGSNLEKNLKQVNPQIIIIL